MPPERFLTCLSLPLRELDGFEQFVDQPRALVARHAVQLGEDEQVFLDAQLEVAGHRLRNDADRRGGRRRPAAHVEAVDDGRARTSAAAASSACG